MRLISVLFLGLFLWLPLRAQDEKIEDFSFEDLPEEELSSFYEIVGVGVIGTAQFLNVDAVQQVAEQLFPQSTPAIDAPLYCAGFYVAESFYPGKKFRFGFLYTAGSRKQTGTVTIGEGIDTAQVQRRLEYGVSYNALTVDYAFVPASQLAIVAGLQLGWGSIRFSAAQSLEQRRFDEEFQFDQPSINNSTTLETLHFFTAPQLAIEWSPTATALLRIAGTYHFSWTGEWKADNIQRVENVPKTLNGGGFGVQIGLFIGLFRIGVP